MIPLSRNRLRTTTAFLLAAALTLPAAAATPAPASETKDITRLGGPNACFRPPLKTGQDLQKLFVKKRADFEAILDMSGWGGQSDELFRAVAEGKFQEVEFPVGKSFQWMALRKRKKLQLAENSRWAGKKPFPAFEIKLTSNNHDYTFYVPKVCGNLMLFERIEVPVPTCALTATPASDCITRSITIDASRSSVERGKVASVTVKVKHPDGKTEELGSADAGFKWSKSWREPGSYTFSAVAVSDRGRTSTNSCTAQLELTPCPPVCALTLSATEVYTGDEFTIDASGSKAQVGALKTVSVEISDAKGTQVSKLDLNSPYTTPTTLKKGGMYTLRAVAEDDLGQRSSNVCEATLEVIPKLGLLTDFYGGTERRDRSDGTVEFCRSAPLLGAKGGLTYLPSPRIELAMLIGGNMNTRDPGNWSLLADFEVNYLMDKGFIGTGIGAWDYTHSETRTGALLLQMGVNTPWKAGRRPIALFVQGRAMLDQLDNLANNYVVWAGLRFHHLN